MIAILRASWRSLRRRAGRFALTGVAVMLGVAFMSGARVFTDTIVKSLNEVISASTTGVDLSVSGQSAIDDARASERPPLPDEFVARIRAVPGVRAAVGAARGPIRVVGRDGKPVGRDGPGFAFVANWVDNETAGAHFNPFEIVDGRAPSAPDELVIDKASASRLDARIGSTLGISGLTETIPMRVVGHLQLSGDVSLPGGTLVATDDATAKRLVGSGNGYNQIFVAVKPGADVEAVRAGITHALEPAAVRVERADQEAQRRRERLEQNIVPFERMLTGFVFVALFVGSFIVANTFGVLLARRTRELALMRTLGAGRTQLTFGLMLEAAFLGVVSGVVGLGVGIFVARLLRDLLARGGLPLPRGDLVITSGTVIGAFVVGVLVTVVAAAAPVVRAGRTRPIAALRDSELEPARVPVLRTVAGLSTVALGVFLFLDNRPRGVDGLSGLGLGAAITIIGMVVVGPALVRPVLRVLGSPALLSGTAGRLARDNARRNPRRTNATAAAVMIGAALVTFVTILAASVKASVETTVDSAFRADYIVDAGFRGGFEPAVVAQLEATEEVGTVSALRVVTADVPGRGRTDVLGFDTAKIDALVDLEPDVPMKQVGPDGVAVFAKEAAARGLHLGDRVELTFPTGPQALVVRSIFGQEFAGGDTPYIVDLSTADRASFERFETALIIDLAPGVSPRAGRAAITRVLAPYPQAQISDRAQLKTQVASRIDRVLNLFYALLGLSVVIAIIGVANTLALSVHERTRELGLLRAVGMSRRQVRTSVRWEAVMVALLGTAVGLALAVAGSWGFVSALHSQGVIRLDIPPVPVAVICAIAVAAAVLAALGPARRAGRIDVLRAIAAE